MTTQNETRRVVEAYFAAWTTKNTEEAYALLAEKLEFTGPGARFESAAAFKPGLEWFASMTRSARISELVVDGERATLLYDCEFPAPAGTLRIASFFRVESGKIRTYEVVFDTTEYKKVTAIESEA
jgi:hypothetical protein